MRERDIDEREGGDREASGRESERDETVRETRGRSDWEWERERGASERGGTSDGREGFKQKFREADLLVIVHSWLRIVIC